MKLAPSDLAFLADGPVRARVTSTLPAEPAEVFAALADQSTWRAWCADCLEARWTSSDVEAAGALRVARFRFATFEERILAWEPGRRFAFSVDACTWPIARRAAEDWVLADKGGGTELSWDLVVDVAPAVRLAWPAARAVAEATFRRTVRGLARYLTTRA